MHYLDNEELILSTCTVQLRRLYLLCILLFPLCIFMLICFVCTSVRTADTE